VLPIAPSLARKAKAFVRPEGTYHENVAKRIDPRKLSVRAQRDGALKSEVRRVFEDNYRVYQGCSTLFTEGH
jgi:hypothetical protein